MSSRLAALLSSSAPHIAAPFWAAADAESLRRHIADGLDIAEIRLDFADCKTLADAKNIVGGYAQLPTILTIRPEWEGGQWKREESLRLQWFEELLPHVDAADVELAAPILAPAAAAAKQQGKTLIISRHCFENGEDKEAIADAAEKAFAAGADIFKFAGQVESEKDSQILRDFLREWKRKQKGGAKGKKIIVIGMGNSLPARRARLILSQNGSCLTFAAADFPSAPGQLSLKKVAAVLRANDVLEP